MTTPAATPPVPLAPPTGDSVLQALSFGFRVLAKPDFLWAPILLAAIQVLPLAFMPAFADPSTAPTTPEEAIAFFRAFLPALAAALLAGLIVGPILTGVCYRLGSQFLRGEEARPFGAELPGLAWRIFLQQLILTVGILLLLFASVAVIALIGDGAGAVLVAFLVLLVLFAVFVAVFIRVAVAIPLTLEGAGPVEALRRSWQLTAGHAGMVFRWVIVIGLLVGLVSALLSGLVTGVFGGVGGRVAGQLLGGAVTAPLAIVSAIAILLLLRLLKDPAPTAVPTPDLPSWMGPPPPAPSGHDVPDWMTPPPADPPVADPPVADPPPVDPPPPDPRDEPAA
jgi:hypothetical protein